MSAAQLIDQSDFDKKKFVFQVVNFCDRHLPMRFLTFADAVALLASMPVDMMDLVASRVVSDVILKCNTGDMSSCIDIAPRSKIYNMLVSDQLLQLRKAVQSSPHDVGVISFVYVTSNEQAWAGDLKVGE